MSAAEAGCLGGLTLASLAGDSCRRFSRRLGGSQAADLQVQPSGGLALGANKGERLSLGLPASKLALESLPWTRCSRPRGVLECRKRALTVTGLKCRVSCKTRGNMPNLVKLGSLRARTDAAAAGTILTAVRCHSPSLARGAVRQTLRGQTR